MYHFINRVYVDTSLLLDHDAKRMTIGKQIGYEYAKVSEFDPEGGVQLFYAESLDAVDHKAFKDAMVQAVSSDEKTTIFCDSDTYVRLYGMFIKALFPNIDFDTFKWIMVCKKAMFNSSVSSRGEPSVDVLSKLVINGAVVKAVYDSEEELQDIIDELVRDNAEELSLEWQIIRLRLDGKYGKIPRVTKNILRKIALSNAHDALEVWARHITRPENWDMAGADIDTLLNGQTVFEGCLRLPHLSSTVLMRPGLYAYRPTDEWLMGMLREAIKLMTHLEDESSAKRAAKILELLADTRPMSDPANCMDRIQVMFNGPMRIALAMRDNGKYDESLIRLILSLDDDKLKDILEGAAWR